MVTYIAYCVFFAGAALFTAAMIIARYTPGNRDDETSKAEWVLVFMIIGGLAMALIGFLVFFIGGAIDNIDHYGRLMGTALLIVAAVVLLAILLAKNATVSRAR